MRPLTLTLTLALTLASTSGAGAQSQHERYPQRFRYEQYGTELRRTPHAGTIDAPLYRGESYHPKGQQTPPWGKWIAPRKRETPDRRNPY